MAEGGFDDIEMRNKNLREEEAETKFSNDDPWDIGDYPENFDEGSPRIKFNTVDIPDVKKDAKGMKKSLTEDKKIFFRKIFDVSLEKKNGENSSLLLDNTEFVKKENGKVSIYFEGKQIGNVNENDEPELYPKKNRKYVDKFVDALKKSTLEYEKTLDSVIDKEMDSDNYEWDPFERNFFKDEIKQNSIEKLNNSIEDIQENMKEIEMEEDVRELNGVLNPKGETEEEKIKFLEIQTDHWRQKSFA